MGGEGTGMKEEWDQLSSAGRPDMESIKSVPANKQCTRIPIWSLGLSPGEGNKSSHPLRRPPVVPLNAVVAILVPLHLAELPVLDWAPSNQASMALQTMADSKSTDTAKLH